jgi:phospholipase/carboxylesterase
MVHGWKGDETVMWIFKQAIPPGAAVISPRAPLAASERGYGWFERDGAELQPEPGSLWAGLDTLHRFLTNLPERYPVDPKRLVLIGFSQGAAMCNTLAITRPGLVKGVASLAGLIPGEVAEKAETDLTGLPVFIAHGTRDETVPLAAARQARDLYSRLGAQVTYGEYPAGHKMTVQAIRDLKHWLAEVTEPNVSPSG